MLSDNVHPSARSAYLALKAVNKKHISVSQGVVKGLSSFVYKCLLLNFMEEQDAAYWETDPAPIEIFIKLLDNLKRHLLNGSFPHYWIEEIDLLADYDRPAILALLNNLERVRYKPQAYIADNWLEMTRCLRHNCCACCAFPRQNTVKVVANTLALQSSSCPLCLVPCSYKEDTLCFGPCPYDKLNMDVY